MDNLFPFFSKEDAQKRRSMPDYIRWVEQMLVEFVLTDDRKKAVRLGIGHSKVFFSEIRPLSLLVQYLADNRTKFGWVKPEIGNQAFDAEVGLDAGKDITIQRIEFAAAVDGYDDSLRMEVLNRNGRVSAAGRILNPGTRRKGRENLKILSEAVSSIALFEKTYHLIRKTLEKKSEIKYEQGIWLAVTFGDHIPRQLNATQLELIRAMAKHHVETPGSVFSRIFVLGKSGRVYADTSLIK